ncbi:MAG: class I SAM-dependent methyltransferase [Patescibacteria group bacterium]
MKKQFSDDEVVAMVHEANAKAHDFHAEMHDRNVPYIHRSSTRAYYWRLLKDACNNKGKDFKDASVLEVGCGTGTFTDLVLLNGASKFYGIDLSPKMINVARLKTKDRKAVYEVAALEFFADKHKNEFDIIFSASFLHHLVDIEGGVQLIKSMLKPGGVYVGLHEPTTTRRFTFIERIDNDFQYLFGYSGSIYTPLQTRIKNLFKGIIISVALRVKALSYLLNVYMKTKKYIKYKLGMSNSVTAEDVQIEPRVNYIDYQLNNEFSLIKKIGSFGKVVPYCYLGFVELMKISKPLNHEMFIMVK